MSYPVGTIVELIAGPHVSAPTRAVLAARLTVPATVPRWFDDRRFAVLAAVCARLVPPGSRATVDVAGAIDARLADGRGNGWRYAALPADGEAYRQGLDRIDAAGGGGFVELDASRQDEILDEAQMSDPRIFEELLAETVEVFYADPLALEEIGYAGIADLPGWTALGLDAREPREPVADG